MRTVFADTGYWIALLNPKDDLHSKARQISESLGPAQIVTSEVVCTELLNFFSRKGAHLRVAAQRLISQLKSDPNIVVVPQTSSNFDKALILYRDREDKHWSHTDCSSFVIMEERRLLEGLTPDEHFEQCGFVALLR